jgi:hypothetical protein
MFLAASIRAKPMCRSRRPNIIFTSMIALKNKKEYCKKELGLLTRIRISQITTTKILDKFQYCDSNIELSSIAPHLVFALNPFASIFV